MTQVCQRYAYTFHESDPTYDLIIPVCMLKIHMYTKDGENGKIMVLDVLKKVSFRVVVVLQFWPTP